MNRPKFAVGEVVDVVSEVSSTVFREQVIRKAGWVENWSPFNSGSRFRSTWRYQFESIPEYWSPECNLRKRPDLRQPFSLESLRALPVTEDLDSE